MGCCRIRTGCGGITTGRLVRQPAPRPVLNRAIDHAAVEQHRAFAPAARLLGRRDDTPCPRDLLNRRAEALIRHRHLAWMDSDGAGEAELARQAYQRAEGIHVRRFRDAAREAPEGEAMGMCRDADHLRRHAERGRRRGQPDRGRIILGAEAQRAEAGTRTDHPMETTPARGRDATPADISRNARPT
jgi:hypothetical protein